MKFTVSSGTLFPFQKLSTGRNVFSTVYPARYPLTCLLPGLCRRIDLLDNDVNLVPQFFAGLHVCRDLTDPMDDGGMVFLAQELADIAQGGILQKFPA